MDQIESRSWLQETTAKAGRMSTCHADDRETTTKELHNAAPRAARVPPYRGPAIPPPFSGCPWSDPAGFVRWCPSDNLQIIMSVLWTRR